MASLGATTALLRSRREAATARARRPSQPRRMVEIAEFGPNPGGLRMLAYAPAGLESPVGLVVVLHGCTQQAERFASDSGWLALADRYGFVVVAPEQTAHNNPNLCFNWFSPPDTTRGGGEAASIAAMTAHAIAAYGLDADRIFVTGLSAGGAMAGAMLATYPDLYAGGAIVAGLPYGVAGTVGQALQAMRGPDGRGAPALGALVRGAAPIGGRIPRISIWHGAADLTVDAQNADAIASQWAWTHGLPVAPSEVTQKGARSHAVWRAADTGQIMIERHLIKGLGHGAPLAAGGAEGVGAAAPFMLEAGVSSSLESLRFWGLAPVAEALPERSDAKRAPEADAPVHEGLGDLVMRSVSGHTSGPVQDMIAKALKTAGLL